MKTDIAVKFWEYIDGAQFDALAGIMNENAQVWCPDTREVYKSARDYIDFNKAYPGRWHADVEKALEAGEETVSVTRVYDDNGASFYCISFFRFEGERIAQITQYWSENGEPPQWRDGSGFVRRY